LKENSFFFEYFFTKLGLSNDELLMMNDKFYKTLTINTSQQKSLRN
jgi:hypothetical protein